VSRREAAKSTNVPIEVSDGGSRSRPEGDEKEIPLRLSRYVKAALALPVIESGGRAHGYRGPIAQRCCRRPPLVHVRGHRRRTSPWQHRCWAPRERLGARHAADRRKAWSSPDPLRGCARRGRRRGAGRLRRGSSGSTCHDYRCHRRARWRVRPRTRRLRPNIVIGGVEGLAERGWPGAMLRSGVVIGIDSCGRDARWTTVDPDTWRVLPAS